MLFTTLTHSPSLLLVEPDRPVSPIPLLLFAAAAAGLAQQYRVR